jgi:plasmid stability protein
MAVMTLREIPDDLQEFLRADAAANHRSMNKQVIVVLDEYRSQRLAAQKTPLSVEEKIALIRGIQASAKRHMLTDNRSDDEIVGYDANGLFR